MKKLIISALLFVFSLSFNSAVFAISENEAAKIAETLCAELSKNLARHGLGEPDVRIGAEEYPKEAMRVNLIQGFYNTESKKLEYYQLIIGEEALNRKVGKLCFAQMLCHEFGHLLGKDANGKHLKVTANNVYDLNGQTSPEGEADYQSLKLLHRLVKRMPSLLNDPLNSKKLQIAQSFVEKATRIKNKAQIEYIAKLITAAQLNIERFSSSHKAISPEKRDPKQVKKTIEDYPSDQSRLDSAVAGILNRPRPRSWWSPR